MTSAKYELSYNWPMPPAQSDACRAWQLLMKFYFAQRAHLPASRGALDLSPAQCHVLHLIEPGRPLPMSRLADTLSCDASNVTGLIDRLESRGLVKREASPTDRRVKALQLTSNGKKVRAALLGQMAERALPLSRLSARQQRTLVTLLEALVDEHTSQR